MSTELSQLIHPDTAPQSQPEATLPVGDEIQAPLGTKVRKSVEAGRIAPYAVLFAAPFLVPAIASGLNFLGIIHEDSAKAVSKALAQPTATAQATATLQPTLTATPYPKNWTTPAKKEGPKG